jgi:hypothetical protein
LERPSPGRIKREKVWHRETGIGGGNSYVRGKWLDPPGPKKRSGKYTNKQRKHEKEKHNY